MRIALLIIGSVLVMGLATWLTISNVKEFAQAKRDRGEVPYGVFNPRWRAQRRRKRE